VSGASIGSRGVRAKNIRRVAGQALAQLQSAAKVHQLYGAENDNVRRAYDGLHARIEEILSFEERLRLHLEDGFLFANEVRLKGERGGLDAVRWLLERFADAGLASLTVARGVKPLEWRRLVPILARASWPEGGAPPDIPRQLEQGFVVNVTVVMRRRRELDAEAGAEVEVSGRKLALALWLKLHMAAREATLAAAQGAAPSLKKVRSLVQLAVDAVAEDEVSLLAASRARGHVPEGTTPATPWRTYLETHQANVCVLSLALGGRLGLSRRQLLDLGTAALMADVGMATVPDAIREKEGRLTPAETAEVQRHTLRGADLLARSDAGTAACFQAASVAATHHLKGYPALGAGAGLLASIVAIADAFDAMTTDRPWRKAHPHDDALSTLMLGRGGHNRLLAKIFANMIGLFPAGAIVELSTGETAVVADHEGEGRPPARPRVRVLIDPEGRTPEGTVLDTAERGPGGAFLRSVARIVDTDARARSPGDLVALL